MRLHDGARAALADPVIASKLAAIPAEYPARMEAYPEFETQAALEAYLAERGLQISQWSAADLDVDPALLGLGGSPTQVYKVNYVVLEATESKDVAPTAEGIRALIEELVQEYIVG